jgi:dihydrofolate reductase
MRKIINSTYISLDGVIDRPHEWPSVGARGDKGDEIQNELLLSCDALIMGRRTYEVFAPVWPTRSGDPASDHINSMRKYVVSSTLSDPEWNNTTVLGGDPVAELKALKQAPGKAIVQYGFGQLAHALMANGLLDELRLWVYPLFVGKAEPSELIYRHGPGAFFELVDTTSLQNGIVILSYRYAQTAPDGS